jgi:hypothetical protein
MGKKSKQIVLNTNVINWWKGKMSHLSIENKLLIYKTVMKVMELRNKTVSLR